LLGGTATEIPCGVSLGIQSGPQTLFPIIEKELGAGYQRIKIKIKPGKDLEFIAAVRREFPSAKLMVDANSSYRLADAAYLKNFDAYDLMMVEQPLAWDDIFDHAALQAEMRTPICLDESIHNADHARAALDLGACQIINIKLGRVGGHSEARRVEEVCRQRSVPVGVAACWKRALDALTTSRCPLFPVSFCLAMFPPAAILGRRHYRAGSGSQRPRNDPSAGKSGTRVWHSAETCRATDGAPRNFSCAPRSGPRRRRGLTLASAEF
jgi:L-alanine-DL-glutamate epimerase-like enolase superfamily enzyme